MSAAPVPILLLKTRSTPHDGYHSIFCPPNYTPTFVPVLEHRYNATSLSRVRHTLRDINQLGSETTGQQIYGGLIFTSQRAVEGFAKVVQGDEDNAEVGSLNAINIPLYAVGPATSRALTELRDAYLPHCEVHGQDTGNGENLARYMLEHYNDIYTSKQLASKPPLLFLVGEQRRDIIPKTLMAETLSDQERIQVDELVVYETAEMASFPMDFDTAVREARNEAREDARRRPSIWIVVFSPTGCEAMLKGLGWLNEQTGKFKGRHDGDGNVFVATIGPTTRDFLRKNFSFEADVCAETPSPEGVKKAIEDFLRLNVS